MCARLPESSRKTVNVTIRFSPNMYSRLLLLAHRHERSLGGEIRTAVHAHLLAHEMTVEAEA